MHTYILEAFLVPRGRYSDEIERGREDICTHNCHAKGRAASVAWMVPNLFHAVCKKGEVIFHLVNLGGLPRGVVTWVDSQRMVGYEQERVWDTVLQIEVTIRAKAQK